MKKKNNKNFEEKNILPSNENIEVGTDSGFDDLMYDNLESDYQYFDGNNFDDEKVEKPVSEELMLVETGDNIILPKNEDAEIVAVAEDKPIKVREIAVQSDSTKVNAFDLFFLRLWAGMVSLLGYTANGINFVINAIFKKKLPVKYIKAFLVVVLIILFLVIILVPASANSQPKNSGSDDLVIL